MFILLADFNPLTLGGREFNPLQLGGTQYASAWIKLPSFSKLHEYKALTFFQVSLHQNWLIKTFDYLLLRIAFFPGSELIYAECWCRPFNFLRIILGSNRL